MEPTSKLHPIQADGCRRQSTGTMGPIRPPRSSLAACAVGPHAWDRELTNWCSISCVLGHHVLVSLDYKSRGFEMHLPHASNIPYRWRSCSKNLGRQIRVRCICWGTLRSTDGEGKGSESLDLLPCEASLQSPIGLDLQASRLKSSFTLYDGGHASQENF